MSTTMEPIRTGVGRKTAVLPEVTVRKFKPVKLWAGVGVAFLAMMIYSMAGWILSGKATNTPVGDDPVPTYMKVILHGWEILGIPVLIIFLWYFLVRPWRRAGHITTDGLFCLAFLAQWWQDPLANWLGPLFTYNAIMINLGNWSSNVPGWFMPDSNRVAEPLVINVMYIYLAFGGAVLGCAVMRKAKARWPQLGTFGLVMVALAFFMFLDVLLEPPMMLVGMWSYALAIEPLTLFYGHYYQYPIYEAFFFGAVWAAWACLRYFKNDKGHTVAERGIDDVRATPKQKTWLRGLALMGLVQTIYLVGYSIPMQFVIANASEMNPDLQDRSYFRNGLCGEGTDYACWGPDNPYPRRGSSRVGTDGQLVPGK